MRNVKGVVALTAVTALLAGCATMVHGSFQDIKVFSEPAGALVRVNTMTTTTPGILHLERKGNHTVVFEKEGFKPIEVHLDKTIDGWFFGNFFFGGLIGIVIDFVNGSAYKLTPEEVNVVFREKVASMKGRKGNVVVFVEFEQLPSEIRERVVSRRIS